MMSAVRTKNTAPELQVRRTLHALVFDIDYMNGDCRVVLISSFPVSELRILCTVAFGTATVAAAYVVTYLTRHSGTEKLRAIESETAGISQRFETPAGRL
jgi:hypothetical protein